MSAKSKMSDQFPNSEELLRHLQERSDDFESVQLMVPNDIPVVGPNGEQRLLKECCGIIKTCNGSPIAIHREEFEKLLNDGILQRLKIPISLVPQINR